MGKGPGADVMEKIKNIAFDLGGVIVTINQETAVKRFKEIGIKDAENRLNPYTQSGIFGDVEVGKITADDFIAELSKMAGHQLTFEDCQYAWKGYFAELPERNLEILKKLRAEGYRLLLLSNTNPFIMRWALNGDFDGHGNTLGSYFDGLYLSYECEAMKPDEKIFRKMCADQNILPADTLFVDDGPRNVAAASEMGFKTFCPKNGSDWTKELYDYL